MSQIVKFLQLILSDSGGNPSMIRAASFLIIFAVLFNWIFLTIKLGTPQSLDTNAMILALGSLGVKVWQKMTEEKSNIEKPNEEKPDEGGQKP